MTQLLSACLRCQHFDDATRQCSLLREPTPENRRRLLLVRACDVPRLLIRSFGEDVGQEAALRWLEMPTREPRGIVESFGARPLDLRLWMSSWPYYNLARDAIKHQRRYESRHSPLDTMLPIGSRDHREGPTGALDLTRALDRLRAIDPVDYEIIVDVLADDFDGSDWVARLACSGATVTNRKALAIYRLLVLVFGVLGHIRPMAAATALRQRVFSPGAHDEASAYRLARESLGALPLSSFRRSYRDGAEQSLRLLAERDAVNRARLAGLEVSFRRVLQLPNVTALSRAEVPSTTSPPRSGVPRAAGTTDHGRDRSPRGGGRLPAPARDARGSHISGG